MNAIDIIRFMRNPLDVEGYEILEIERAAANSDGELSELYSAVATMLTNLKQSNILETDYVPVEKANKMLRYNIDVASKYCGEDYHQNVISDLSEALKRGVKKAQMADAIERAIAILNEMDLYSTNLYDEMYNNV